MDSCPVCVEDYTKSVKICACPHCQFQSCAKCCMNYILESAMEPRCMSCSKEWSYRDMSTLFTKKFISTDLRDKRQSILLEREKMLLPESQAAAVASKKKREYQNELNELMRQRRELTKQIDEHKRSPKCGTEIEIEKVKLIHSCPADGCHGFLSDKWRCELCQIKVCKRCLEIKEDEHACDAETILSVKAIKADSTPCPSCGVRIHRISGCLQMWCTNCNTAFDYGTGKIVKGPVHNPHYTDYLVKHGINQGVNQEHDHCNIHTTIADIVFQLSNNQDISQTKKNFIYEIRQNVLQIQDEEFRRYPAYEENVYRRNADLRVRFLLNEITEISWKRTLLRREKQSLKSGEIRQALTIFCESAFGIVLTVPHRLDALGGVLKEFKHLKSYTRDQLADILEVYGGIISHYLKNYFNL